MRRLAVVISTVTSLLMLVLLWNVIPLAVVPVLFLTGLLGVPASLVLWLTTFCLTGKPRRYGKIAAVVLLLYAPCGFYGAIAGETVDEMCHKAARNGSVEWLRSVLHGGPDVVDTHGNSILMKAAQYGHTGVVRELLKRGARTNYRDSDGDTALALAERYKHTEIITLLREAGAHR